MIWFEAGVRFINIASQNGYGVIGPTQRRARAEVTAFTHNLEDELFALQAELRAFTYAPGAYRSFVVHEPKRRLISAAPFRDRVVHHALVQVIEPLFERRFNFDSYANRVGRGTHAALDRFTHFAWRFRYVMLFDVREFFPSVDHAILRDQLARVVRDKGRCDCASGFWRRARVCWRANTRRCFSPATIGSRSIFRVACPLATSPASAAGVLGWAAHAAHGDTWRLRGAVLNDVARSLRG
jgi:hypothetical protein